MKNTTLPLAAFAVACLASTASAQFTITNPSFENPDNDGSSPFFVPANWSTFGNLNNVGAIDQSNSNIPNAADGTQWLFMTADGATDSGVDSESFGSSTVGGSFDVSFELGKNLNTNVDLITGMNVVLQGSNDGFSSVGGTSSSSTFDPSAIIGGGNSAGHSVTITSPGAFNDVRLRFQVLASGSNNKDQVLVDNVSVIPEPGSYALIGGLLALGAVILRRLS